jgi:hypothetical protein
MFASSSRLFPFFIAPGLSDNSYRFCLHEPFVPFRSVVDKERHIADGEDVPVFPCLFRRYKEYLSWSGVTAKLTSEV